ncbi:glutamate-5-semialdehyde dehydrogenase [Rhodothalassium salexigens DSM 2132]|uniref:Gamma-glutamyl phosphate reductase n=1 Tax=Rhodothalassium salexigens DSM 2132 TaxID=1188247 RepID=A0A4R2PLX5_RHOSA|nr:glutamate-5-semialdehyde dehydrogenase [Rhodothalassium salexigens]MBB4210865.1 glutamate-5-semialdehyde dehydrogenase [Rhodothalassium salexigens DSM 2132]MBK1639154.1 glutamate-5-semialdehyde dehydrogenase [Rhodothalassium salexigens DSM 2132]TCP36477.1 glutamate-5-semialdehyde dehydrogenase [Rhodothalassium salexigens DSM 2132]
MTETARPQTSQPKSAADTAPERAPADIDAADDRARRLIAQMGAAARACLGRLAAATSDDKTHALVAAARAIEADAEAILAANARDMAAAEARGLAPALLDRLRLDTDRLAGIVAAVDKVAHLPDPVGRTLASWQQPNGLAFERVATPLGVVGVIYESRPNVTADAAALCVKAGNAVILRGGSEAVETNRALHAAFAKGLASAGLPGEAVQLVPDQDRRLVAALLGATGVVDVIVPRGGRSLVERVEADARVPVFAHLEGLCHMLLDAAADPDRARDLALNAKMRRTGICGALETLLVHKDFAPHLPPILDALKAAGCALRGDAGVCALDAEATPASEADWATEYLDAILAVRLVDDLDAALDHIARYGSGHTDAIVTEDRGAAERFLAEVDSAIVLHNASTQFADGGEFGFGAEIGIATGRVHARGPVGPEQLTTFKYKVRGSGQTRP